MGQIQSLLKSMEKSLIDSKRLWIKPYLFICPSVLTFYVSHLSLSISFARGNLGRTKHMVKINKVTALFNTFKKKPKLAWVYFKWAKVCGWRAEQHLNYQIQYIAFFGFFSASYQEINLWNCMWLKRFKMIQNRMGEGTGGSKKQEKGRKRPTTNPHTLFDYIILILHPFFPFIKHITQCADSLQFIKKTWDMLMHKILGPTSQYVQNSIQNSDVQWNRNSLFLV